MSYYGKPLPKTPYPDKLKQLAAAIPHLDSKDKAFALSLHDGHVKYNGWTEKQVFWASKMIDKVWLGGGAGGHAVAVASGANPLSAVGVSAIAEALSLPPTFPAQAPVANDVEMSKVFTFFAHAGENLKTPAVLLKVPGSTDIVVKKKKGLDILYVSSTGGYGNNTYYGKITGEGKWVPKLSLNKEFSDKIVEGLKEFAHNPAKVASKYGKMTGKCCFCNKTLTDAKSTSVGYGPVCAASYHLPWGSTANTYYPKKAPTYVGIDPATAPDKTVFHKATSEDMNKIVTQVSAAEQAQAVADMKKIINPDSATLPVEDVDYTF